LWGTYYAIQRRTRFDLLDQLPIDIPPVDDPFVREAAEIKSGYPIAYADALCTALDQRHKGRILTGDPEFMEVEKLVTDQWLKVRN
jgi:predicted nucleic acid-binding protein